MFSKFRQILGLLKITTTPTDIVIEGIPYDVLERDISRIWKTSKISLYMFTRLSSTSVSFPLFFAPEVVYALNEILNDDRVWSNKRVISRIIEKLLTETWLISTQEEPSFVPLDLSRTKDIDLKPLDFQMEFYHAFNSIVPRYKLRGMLLAGAAGSGKTTMALTLAHCAYAEKTIVVCPKNAVERVWEANIIARHHGKAKYWLSTSKAEPSPDTTHFVIHYDALNKALLMVDRFKSDKTIVILDESHNLNELASQQTQLFIKLCSDLKPTYVVPMSGTPIKALGSESIPLFKTIDPYFTDETQFRFKKIYGANATKALDILNHRLGLVTFYVGKDRLKLDKPTAITVRVKVPNGDNFTLEAIAKDMRAFVSERKDYYKTREIQDHKAYHDLVEKALSLTNNRRDQEEFKTYKSTVQLVRKAANNGGGLALKDVIEEIAYCTKFENASILPKLVGEEKKIFRDVRSIYKYLALKIQGEALGRVLGRKRIECHIAMAPYIDFPTICNSTQKKTVVFTSYVDVLEKIVSDLSKKGLNPLAVYGKTNSELAKIISEFEKNEDLNPLVATYDSLSTAVPLVMADTMVLVNSPFRTYILEQTISRIHRLGADTKVSVYTVLLDTGDKPNISTRSSDILKWSQEQVAAITGVESPFKVDENDSEFTVGAESFEISNTYTLRLRDVI